MDNNITLSTKIDKIENIFQDYNIFKSIFVCSVGKIDTYFTLLLQNDFPITKLETIHKFNNHHSRILLLDEESIKHLDFLECDINISDINMVIYLDDITPSECFDNVPVFFL